MGCGGGGGVCGCVGGGGGGGGWGGAVRDGAPYLGALNNIQNMKMVHCPVVWRTLFLHSWVKL